MIEAIIDFDKRLLLALNGSDSTFVDAMAMFLTNAKTWIPLYIVLLIMVVIRSRYGTVGKCCSPHNHSSAASNSTFSSNHSSSASNAWNCKRVFDVVFVVACAGLCVLLAGTIDDEIVKPTVARLRPTHDPEIGALVDIVDGYRGGRYGFFSAHASNTFSIAIFFSLLMRKRLLTIVLISYSLINCWTRIYLGVHYPLDILCGLLWGGSVGMLVYNFYKRVINSRIYVRLTLKHSETH